MEVKSYIFVASLAFLASACSSTGNAQGVLPSSNGEDLREIKGSTQVGSLGILGMGDIYVYKNKLPPVAKVTVQKTFHDARADCQEGKPTEQDIAEFFSLAYEISSYSATKYLNVDPCFSEGAISFVDGSKGKWMVRKTGSGFLTMSNGVAYSYYCPECSGTFTLEDLDEKTLKKYGRVPEK